MTVWRERSEWSLQLRRYVRLHGRVVFPVCGNKLDNKDYRVENMLVGDDDGRRHSAGASGSGYIYIPMTALHSWYRYELYSDRL